MFCKIEQTNLDGLEIPEIELKKTPSSTNDDCHFDILNIGDNKCKNFAKSHFKAPNIYICCRGEIIQINKENIEDLINFITPCVTGE